MLEALATVMDDFLVLVEHRVNRLNKLVDVVQRERAKVGIVALVKIRIVHVDHFCRRGLERLRPRRAEIKLAYRQRAIRRKNWLQRLRDIPITYL